MKRYKLTTAFCRELKWSGKQTDIYDSELKPFGIRIQKTQKVFFVRKYIGVKQIRVSIDTTSNISADTARKRALEIISQINAGINPNAEKAKAREQGRTLAEVMELFFVSRKRIKERTVETYSRHVNSYLSGWKDVPLKQISKDMIASRHLTIGKKHGGATANGVMRTFRALYNFAKNLDETLPENPVKRLSAIRQWFRVDRRTTLIKSNDMPAFWQSLNNLKNPIIREYLKLILFTGLRRREGLRLEWKHVDMDNRTFVIIDPKNHNDHILPMSEPIFQIFQSMAEIRENDFVFAGTGKSGHLEEPIRAIRQIEKEAGIKFCVHDLRRTFGTIAENVVSYTVLKRLMNHSQAGDVTQGYLILTLDNLRIEIERVSNKILSLCESKNGKVLEFTNKKAI